MSHTARRLSPREDDKQRSSQPQRSEAGRDVGDAMSRCPQYRCADLAAPKAPSYGLPIDWSTVAAVAGNSAPRFALLLHRLRTFSGTSRNLTPSLPAIPSVRSSVLVWNAATRSRIGTTAGGYRSNQILRAKVPAESGEKRGRAVRRRSGRFVRPSSKKAPVFIDSKPASENRRSTGQDCRV